VSTNRMRRLGYPSLDGCLTTIRSLYEHAIVPRAPHALDSNSSATLFTAASTCDETPNTSPKLSVTRGEVSPTSADWVPLPARCPFTSFLLFLSVTRSSHYPRVFSSYRKSFSLSPSGRELEAIHSMFGGPASASRGARESCNANDAGAAIELQPAHAPQQSPFAPSDASAVNVLIMLDSESLSSYRYIPSLKREEDQRMLTLQVRDLSSSHSSHKSHIESRCSLCSSSCCAPNTPSRSASGRRKSSCKTRAAGHPRRVVTLVRRKSRTAQELAARTLHSTVGLP
jgi:hypothetical protein